MSINIGKNQIIFLSLLVLFIPFAFASHFDVEPSLKQQINENLSFNEILCPNNNHVLAERTNGKLSCVYYETAEKLNWTIRDKEVRVNLLLNNDPAVKDCVPKGPDDVYPTMPYRNSTHSFDVGVCEWKNTAETNLAESSTTDNAPVFVVVKNGTTFDIEYMISSGEISNILTISEYGGLLFDISSSTNGTMSVFVPNEFYMIEEYVHYSPMVLIKGEEVESNFEIRKNSTVIIFDFPQNAQNVEVIFAWYWD